MRQLHVLRHFKSSWAEPGREDRERRLAPTGERGGAEMAAYIEAHGIRSEIVLCSSAERARQTLGLIRAALGDPEVRVEPAVYDSGVDGVLDLVTALDPAIGSAMVIGHNPTLHDLVLRLVTERDGGLATAAFPTGALASLSFAGTWAELGHGPVRLDRLVVPRELPTAG